MPLMPPKKHRRRMGSRHPQHLEPLGLRGLREFPWEIYRLGIGLRPVTMAANLKTVCNGYYMTRFSFRLPDASPDC